MIGDVNNQSPLPPSLFASVKGRIPDGVLQWMQRNTVRQSRVKATQDRRLREDYSPDTERLVAFLTLGSDQVNGGILSISSIYEETQKLKHIHQAEVILCTPPGQPSLLQYTKFANQNRIYRFSQILPYFRNLRSIIIHIPVVCVRQFVTAISKKDRLLLRSIGDVHLNIAIQNIDFLPDTKYIQELGVIGRLTCSTAHERYTTPELRTRLDCPVHKLSVWMSPEQYDRKTFAKKQELMIVSPDPHQRRAEVLSLIREQLPELRVTVIKNLTYEEFKDIISRAKWALTFGEGLDCYFVETVFSGGIAFAVYNSRFFTEDFGRLRTVYASYDELLQRICVDLKHLDNETDYAAYQQEEHELCRRYYDHRQYVRNLEMFYRGEYTYK